MSDQKRRRRLRRLQPETPVYVSQSVYDDDYHLYGNATVVKTTEDGMVKVRFIVETWVSLERVEVRP